MRRRFSDRDIYARRLRCEPLEDRRMLSITLFVDDDAGPSGDGQAWDSAYDDLQSALSQAAISNSDGNPATDVDQIWIAEGTYKPTAELEPGDARSASFSLLDGVTLYGGFVGGEDTLDGRDWSVHITTLSGDLGTLDDSSDNAYTVVYCGYSVEAAIDGVSITGGNADGYFDIIHHPERRSGGGIANLGTLTFTNSTASGNSSSFSGGGIYNDGSLTVTNSAISGNSTNYSGGGIYNDSGTLTVTNSAFSGNRAKSGGGIYNSSGTLTVIDSMISDNSLFEDNYASGGDGGGIHNRGTLTVTNSAISENSTKRGGGGLYNVGTLTVTNSTISLNLAKSGGGICNLGILAITNSTLSGNKVDGFDGDRNGGGIFNSGTTTLISSTLLGNFALDDAGGIFNKSSMAVTDSTISGNSARSGGGIYNDSNSGSATLIVTNSTLSGNLANSGGGIYNRNTLAVTNSTISGNLANSSGGGVYSARDSSITTLHNAIIAENIAANGPDVYNYSGTLSGSYNLIGDRSGQTSIIDKINGNIVGIPENPIDPRLSDFTKFDNGRWGYQLMHGSLALDAGNNVLAVDDQGLPLAEDIAGNSRIQGGTVDIGAIEGITTETPAQIYVVTSLDDVIVAADGELTFREAFGAAQSNQPVGDAPAGSFSEHDIIRFVDGINGSVLLDGVELLIIGDLSIEGPGAASLSFDAQEQNRVFTILPGVSCVLSGMAINGGSANNGGGIYNMGTLTTINTTLVGNSANNSGFLRFEGYGGGIYNIGLLTLENSTLADNTANIHGGGIANVGILTLTNSTISGNSANSGGGIFNSGTLSVTNSTLVGNSTEGGDGGGISNHGTLTLTNSTISGNSASDGGGIRQGSGTMTISNSVLSGNSARFGGGIASESPHFSPSLNITNSTISGNSGYYGGGIYSVGSTLMIANTILYSNVAQNGADYFGDLTPQSSNNLIGGDPLFVRNPSDGGDGWVDDPGTLEIDEAANNDYGDLRLMPDSPAINGGSNALAVDADGNPLETDLAGNPRILLGTVDMGAYEYVPRIDISAVVVNERTVLDAGGEADGLPVGVDWIDEWQTFWVEVWVETPGVESVGVASAMVDLKYHSGCHTATGIEYGAGFEGGGSDIIDDEDGTVAGLGGSALRADVGDDRPALLARVRFEPMAADTGMRIDDGGVYVDAVSCGIVLRSPQAGLVGEVTSETRLGDDPAAQLRAVAYDMNDDGEVDLGDLAFFALVYGQQPGVTSDSPFAYAADFDRSGRVDLGDLAYFAANYRLGRPNDSIVYPVEVEQSRSVVPQTALTAAVAVAVPDMESERCVGHILREAPLSKVPPGRRDLLLTAPDHDPAYGAEADDDLAILAHHWLTAVEDMGDEENDARRAVFAAEGALLVLLDET